MSSPVDFLQQNSYISLHNYTTVNEEGVLNNYATEPQTYYAEYPAMVQLQLYLLAL